VPPLRRARVLLECLVYLAWVHLIVGKGEVELTLRDVVLGEDLSATRGPSRRRRVYFPVLRVKGCIRFGEASTLKW